MDQGVAIVLAAVVTAVVAGLAGLGGVVLGGRISANAAREAAKIGADAAREAAHVAKAAADADREAARAAQFADRLSDLGSRMLNLSDRWVRAVEFVREDGSADLSGDSHLLDEFMVVSHELRLLVRLEETYSALISLIDTTDYLSQAAGDERQWTPSIAQQQVSRMRFEDAIRAELGRDPVSRPWFIKQDGKYADGH
jgi:hypothetical protein